MVSIVARNSWKIYHYTPDHELQNDCNPQPLNTSTITLPAPHSDVGAEIKEES